MPAVTSHSPNRLPVQEVLLRADAKAGYQLTQIIMEHCDKGSLLQAISRGLFLPSSKWGPRLALRALLRTAQEVAQGMWHIHQCNVIHGGEWGWEGHVARTHQCNNLFGA